MKKKIIIKAAPDGFSSVVVCPQCGENLFPVDLESFPQCPYCNCLFDRDAALDDFIASPRLQRWAGDACGRFFRP